MAGWRATAFVVVCLSVSANAYAKVAKVQLDRLAADADVIVIATVTGIERGIGGRIAEATVETVVKGDAEIATVHYVASPTWVCDTSDAVKGERVLLFLNDIKKEEPEWFRPVTRLKARARQLTHFYEIGWHGQGRLVIDSSQSAVEQAESHFDVDFAAYLKDRIGQDVHDILASVLGVLEAIDRDGIEGRASLMEGGEPTRINAHESGVPSGDAGGGE
ncbi:MAG: hypothetical protein AMXMBFR84_21150 [Candidatus Hydrogenedentota bacterium]